MNNKRLEQRHHAISHLLCTLEARLPWKVI
jgi:hypothetical protein